MIRQWWTYIAVVFFLSLSGIPELALARLKAGEQAPDFTLKSNVGKNLRLSEYRGSVVLLNFWASWCNPCRKALPKLNALQQKYGRIGFVTLAISIDEDQHAAEMLAKELDVHFPVLYDTNKRVSRRYAVEAMPSTLLVDRDGILRHVNPEYQRGNEKIYEQQLRGLLSE